MFHLDNLARSLAQIGAQPSFSIFDELKAVYTEPSRYYHTDTHIADCLTHLQTLRHQATHPAEIEVALWFHDAVYDTRRTDNEVNNPYLLFDKQVGLANEEMDNILVSHLIDPEPLRNNDFGSFYTRRKAELLAIIGRTMNKDTISDGDEQSIETEETN